MLGAPHEGDLRWRSTLRVGYSSSVLLSTSRRSATTKSTEKSFGVTLIGHRRKLLSAIAALSAVAPAASRPDAVAPTTAPARVPAPAPTPAQAERRQLTVMFCDLVGSTVLSTG